MQKLLQNFVDTFIKQAAMLWRPLATLTRRWAEPQRNRAEHCYSQTCLEFEKVVYVSFLTPLLCPAGRAAVHRGAKL